MRWKWCWEVARHGKVHPCRGHSPGQPPAGLERYEGAPDLARSATRQALEKLVQLALEQAVDFVLLVGDLYDGDWRDYNTGLFFRRQMTRLQEAGIPVFMVRGNHDAASQIALRLSPPRQRTGVVP